MNFINTDPNMLKLFMRFLREELEVEDEVISLRILYHTTDDEEIEEIKTYWLAQLQLHADTRVELQLKIGTSSRKTRYRNGICSILVYRTEVVQHIYGAIQEYIGFENPKWGQ